MRKAVLIGGLLVVVLSVVLGLRLDSKSFAVNLLAGIVILVVGVGTTLVVIDRYQESRRKARWARAQTFTFNAIAVHLGEITGSLFLHYRLSSQTVSFFHVHLTPRDAALLDAFDSILDELRHSPEANVRDKSPSDAAVGYYNTLQWDFAEISNVLIPRVLESPADQSLIDSLEAFDGARRELRHAIIAHQQAVTQSVFPKVIKLIERARGVYADLLKAS